MDRCRQNFLSAAQVVESAEPDRRQLCSLRNQLSTAVPDETCLVDPTPLDQLRPLQHLDRSRSRQSAHICRHLEGRHPAGGIDVEGRRRIPVDGEHERMGVERLAAG
jgi:hypothetical protein